MLDIYLQVASLLTVAMLFGGMFLFSGGFAAFLFRHLPPEGARMLIRKAFPPFYMFVIAASGLAMEVRSIQCCMDGFGHVDHGCRTTVADACDQSCN